MKNHRYKLEQYKGNSTRFLCPSCEDRKKTFVRYIDTETGEHLDPAIGRCNRESNCGYHKTPKQYFQENPNSIETTLPKLYTKTKPTVVLQKDPSFIPVEIFKASLQNCEGNNFVKYLKRLLGLEVANNLIGKYFIGSSNHWDGATIFWQIDSTGKVRTGQIILYDPCTGKRSKDTTPEVYWAHSALKMKEFVLRQCIFGEHLLQDKTKPVAIVESPKTTIIASIYFPQLIWLAVGGLSNLNEEKCSVLKGREVFLFPDLSKPKSNLPTAFEKWSKKANELSHITNFIVSDLLEKDATEEEREKGLDLADYLVRYDPKDFLLTESITVPLEETKVAYEEAEVSEGTHHESAYSTLRSKFIAPEIYDEYIANMDNPHLVTNNCQEY